MLHETTLLTAYRDLIAEDSHKTPSPAASLLIAPTKTWGGQVEVANSVGSLDFNKVPGPPGHDPMVFSRQSRKLQHRQTNHHNREPCGSPTRAHFLVPLSDEAHLRLGCALPHLAMPTCPHR